MADKKEALEWAVIPPSSATRSIVPDVDHDYDIFDAKIGAALVSESSSGSKRAADV